MSIEIMQLRPNEEQAAGCIGPQGLMSIETEIERREVRTGASDV